MIEVKILFEDEEAQDTEYLAVLVAVPRVGEYVSIGSIHGDYLLRFEVLTVWHYHLDDKHGVDLFCRKLAKRETIKHG